MVTLVKHWLKLPAQQIYKGTIVIYSNIPTNVNLVTESIQVYYVPYQSLLDIAHANTFKQSISHEQQYNLNINSLYNI